MRKDKDFSPGQFAYKVAEWMSCLRERADSVTIWRQNKKIFQIGGR